jgi:outer membrane lipoprotein SlyB
MTAGAKLTANGCEMDKTWALVVSPKIASVIAQTVASDGFSLADLALKNGYAGNFAGYKVYSSNNVKHSRAISFSSVVATDEITVAGVKFTFVASIGSTAGNVLKGASDAASLANLAAAINGVA